MPPERGDKPQRDVLLPGTAPPNHATTATARPPPPRFRPSPSPPLLLLLRIILARCSHLPLRREKNASAQLRAEVWAALSYVQQRERMEAAAAAAAAAPAPAGERDPEHHHGCLAVRTSLPRCAIGAGGGSSLPGSSGQSVVSPD